MSLTNEVKKYIIGAGMDIVGIAPASAFDSEPEGHRPEDILPGAKSVIVFGKRIIDGVTQALFRVNEDGRKAVAAIYGTHGYELAPNFVLLFATFNISQFIERTFGKTAVPLPCGPIQNSVPRNTVVPDFFGPVMDGLPFNIPNAAVAAGLGEYGWSGRVLTPEFGPRVKFGAVITSMELDYDKPYSGDKLCDRSKCKVCIERCPTNAISESESVSFDAGGVNSEKAMLNRNRCMVASCGLMKRFNNSVQRDYIDTTDPTDEQIFEAFKNKPAETGLLDHAPKWKCDLCLAYCPVGSWDNRFGKNGLSSK